MSNHLEAYRTLRRAQKTAVKKANALAEKDKPPVEYLLVTLAEGVWNHNLNPEALIDHSTRGHHRALASSWLDSTNAGPEETKGD